MRGLPDDASRATAEKAAMVAPIAPKVAGDLVVHAHWDAGADLDVSLVTPSGTRVSWMGGRDDVTVEDSTSTEREELAVKRLRHGNYLIEITRGDTGHSTVRGSLDLTVLGVKKTLPFELTGSHAVVGRVGVTLESHLEALDGSGFRTDRVPMARVQFGSTSDTRFNRLVRARAGVFRRCYQMELNRNPGLSGRIVVNARIGEAGQVTSARVNQSTLGNRAAESCVMSNVMRLKFPADPGAGTRALVIPMMFSPS